MVMERTNLRHLRPEHLPERPALATLDLSFISLLKVRRPCAGALRVLPGIPVCNCGAAEPDRPGCAVDAAQALLWLNK